MVGSNGFYFPDGSPLIITTLRPDPEAEAQLKADRQYAADKLVEDKKALERLDRQLMPLPRQNPLPSPPREIRRRINPKDGAEMVYVAAGLFLMGDEDQSDNPRRTVTLRAFWIYKTPVTVAEYRKFCQATGRELPEAPNWAWKDDHPIVNVTWDDARAYCDWAGALLPTEAQWEKAARGTDGRQYPWGNEWDPGGLWCSVGQSRISTAPVGSSPAGASPYGCLDMAGNVWQWCADWYDADYLKSAPATNPTGHPSGTRRVLRGGSWDVSLEPYFRSALRFNSAPSSRGGNVGFRCVGAVRADLN